MTNYLKMAIFIFAIIPFSIIYFLSLFGLYDLLNQFIEKLLIFIAILGLVCLCAILIVLGIFKLGTLLIDKLTSRSYDASPTTQAEVQNIESRGATVQESMDVIQESSGGVQEFNFAKYKSPNEAGSAYKQSQEHRNTMGKIRTIDEILSDARKLTQEAI